MDFSLEELEEMINGEFKSLRPAAKDAVFARLLNELVESKAISKADKHFLAGMILSRVSQTEEDVKNKDENY